MIIQKLVSFNPDLINVKGQYEGVMNNLINNNYTHFYLSDFLKTRYKNPQKLKEARFNLTALGLIIPVMDTDSFLGWTISKLPESKTGKLINITYQSHRVPLLEKYSKYKDKELFKEIWLENFNNWVDNYYPKIKNQL